MPEQAPQSTNQDLDQRAVDVAGRLIDPSDQEGGETSIDLLAKKFLETIPTDQFVDLPFDDSYEVTPDENGIYEYMYSPDNVDDAFLYVRVDTTEVAGKPVENGAQVEFVLEPLLVYSSTPVGEGGLATPTMNLRTLLEKYKNGDFKEGESFSITAVARICDQDDLGFSNGPIEDTDVMITALFPQHPLYKEYNATKESAENQARAKEILDLLEHVSPADKF